MTSGGAPDEGEFGQESIEDVVAKVAGKGPDVGVPAPEAPAVTPAPEAPAKRKGKKAKPPATPEAPAKGKGKGARRSAEVFPPRAAEKNQAAAVAAPGDLAQGALPPPPVRYLRPELSGSQLQLVREASKAVAVALTEGKAGKPYRIDPTYLLIPGIDLPGEEEDPLYDPERIGFPIDDQFVTAMAALGWKESEPAPVVLRKLTVGVEELVVPIPENARQRTKTAREVNKRFQGQLTLAPFVVVQGLSEDDQAVDVEVLNAYRFDDTTTGKARKAARLFRRLKDESVVATAMRLGSTQQVKNYLVFANAPAQVQRAVDAGKITLTSIVGGGLLRLPSAGEQVECLSEALADGVTSVAGIRALVKQRLGEVEKGGGGSDEDAGDEGGSGKGEKGEKAEAPLEWQAGLPPKKRLVKRLIERMLSSDEEVASDPVLVGAIKFARWIMDGEKPPAFASPHLRAVLNGWKPSKDEEE